MFIIYLKIHWCDNSKLTACMQSNYQYAHIVWKVMMDKFVKGIMIIYKNSCIAIKWVSKVLLGDLIKLTMASLKIK